jgi:hypothetical protein
LGIGFTFGVWRSLWQSPFPTRDVPKPSWTNVLSSLAVGIPGDVWLRRRMRTWHARPRPESPPAACGVLPFGAKSGTFRPIPVFSENSFFFKKALAGGRDPG